jgi:hypothetical protein
MAHHFPFSMTRRQAPQQPPEPPLALTVSREEARTKIGQPIEKGRALLNIEVRTEAELDKTRADKSRWADYTKELLRRLFTNQTPAIEFEYAGAGGRLYTSMRPPPLRQLVADFHGD